MLHLLSPFAFFSPVNYEVNFDVSRIPSFLNLLLLDPLATLQSIDRVSGIIDIVKLLCVSHNLLSPSFSRSLRMQRHRVLGKWLDFLYPL